MRNPVLRRHWSVEARVTGMATVVVAVLLAAGMAVFYALAPAGHFHDAPRDLTFLLLGFAVALAAVAWSVWHAVKRALRPVRTMTGELDTISDDRTFHQVTVPAGHDEVAELAGAVNRTLRRLERLNERQRAWVADASHELRSPLTGLRAKLELALEHPEDEDWPGAARSALVDADRLHRIISDLLVMAKLEAGVLGEQETIDLGELVRAETARRGGRVPIELETDEGVLVHGARSHLIRLLTNLLDNADRHARTWVRVAVGTDGRHALLMVADDGPGIPPEERERVFQRFQRLAEGRRCDAGGTGLGLPISRDIAIAHGGNLVVGDADGTGGARLVLRLPLA
ncbi:HAMP domain-containing sensor histidine kinase [Spirillospora sp. NPDC029432]|uniref:sensor histidine kinase n=1 Tax=Spirillospora sp. NPDC029432 TaxID=3154599 RepID=UPI003455E6E3